MKDMPDTSPCVSAVLILSLGAAIVTSSHGGGQGSPGDAPPCGALPPPESAGSFLIENVLVGTDTDAHDDFGWSGSLSGNHAIIGAHFDDEQGTNSGSAVLFRRESGTWVEVLTLMAFDGQAYDTYGRAVVIDQGVIAVGAPNDDDNGSSSGSVYIYRQIGESTWIFEEKLSPEAGQSGELVGQSLALSGDLLAVGAPGAGSGQGAVYIYRRSDDSWQQHARLTVPDGAPGHELGASIATDGIIVTAGEPYDDHVGTKTGAAWVFTETSGAWQVQEKLIASDAAAFDRFGYSIAAASGRVVVGAYTEDPYEITNAGSIYVYEQWGDQWEETAKLAASEPHDFDEFGFRLSIHATGDAIAVGAIRAEEDGLGLDFDHGAAYLFREHNGQWLQTQRIIDEDPDEWDLFGMTVSLSCDSLLVGISRDDTAGTNAGAARIYINPYEAPPPCPGDIAPSGGDGLIGFNDLLLLLNGWGACMPGGACPADLDMDGQVGFNDVLILLNAWGLCDP